MIADGARQSRRRGGARIVARGLSLAELRALMDRAALFIGGDSGPLHIAATTDVPMVGLYGPTLPERSAPWRPAPLADRFGRRRAAALPAVRSARVRAGRLPVL